MIQNTFEAITKADIDALINCEVNESKTLEYKQVLPGGSDGNKKEFLYDVSSFANASGGDILYGIKAAVDESGKKTGAPASVQPIHQTSADEAKLRLEEMIRTGIEPRPRVQIKEIHGWDEEGNGFVILLRIPKSFASPHMVTFKGDSRFYSRNSAGKYQLDVHELRTSFLATESQAERIKRFRQDRLGKIVADETPVMLSSPHRLVLHLIPMASFLNDARLDLSKPHSLTSNFRPLPSFGLNHRYNLDGSVNWFPARRTDRAAGGYTQLFFNGAVEMVNADVLQIAGGEGEQGGAWKLASIAYEQELIKTVESYLNDCTELDLMPPIVISLALLGCKGAYMAVSPRQLVGPQHPIDRDAAILPDVVIDSLDVDVPQVMKPIFDAVWNACGYPGSLNYDKTGTWNPR